MVDELIQAIWIVWFVVFLITALALLTPFLISQHQLSLRLPACQQMLQTASSCPACGLTTAFYALSDGDVTAAQDCHPVGLWIWSLLLTNQVVFSTVLIRQSKNVYQTFTSSAKDIIGSRTQEKRYASRT